MYSINRNKQIELLLYCFCEFFKHFFFLMKYTDGEEDFVGLDDIDGVEVILF